MAQIYGVICPHRKEGIFDSGLVLSEGNECRVNRRVDVQAAKKWKGSDLLGSKLGECHVENQLDPIMQSEAFGAILFRCTSRPE